MDRPRRKIRNVTAILDEIWGSDDKDDSNNGETDCLLLLQSERYYKTLLMNDAANLCFYLFKN